MTLLISGYGAILRKHYFLFSGTLYWNYLLQYLGFLRWVGKWHLRCLWNESERFVHLKTRIIRENFWKMEITKASSLFTERFTRKEEWLMGKLFYWSVREGDLWCRVEKESSLSSVENWRKITGGSRSYNFALFMVEWNVHSSLFSDKRENAFVSFQKRLVLICWYQTLLQVDTISTSTLVEVLHQDSYTKQHICLL